MDKLEQITGSNEPPSPYSSPSPKEHELISRPKSDSRELAGPSVRFVELEDDGAAVFKPALERDNNKTPKRERAAYLVSRFLDLDLAPPTVLREIDSVEGSLQEFIPDAELGFQMSDLSAGGELKNQLFALWIFDYLILNRDRHSGNFLIKGGKIYAIDNEFSFKNSGSWERRTFYGERVPEEIIKKVDGFLQDSFRKDLLRGLLKELLPEEQVSAFFARVESLGSIIKDRKVIEEGDLENRGF